MHTDSSLLYCMHGLEQSLGGGGGAGGGKKKSGGGRLAGYRRRPRLASGANGAAYGARGENKGAEKGEGGEKGGEIDEDDDGSGKSWHDQHVFLSQDSTDFGGGRNHWDDYKGMVHRTPCTPCTRCTRCTTHLRIILLYTHFLYVSLQSSARGRE
jgi:hypothetical protein